MKSPAVIIVLIAFLIGFGTLGSLWGWFDKAPAPFAGKPESVAKSIAESTDFYTIAVVYPEFMGFPSSEAQALNEKIRAFVDDQITIFTEDATVPSASEIDKSSLSIEHTVHTLTPNLISIEFKNSYYISGSAHPGGYTLVFNYLPQSGIFIELRDIFTGEYLEVLSERAREYLDTEIKVRGNPTYDVAWFRRGTDTASENFQTFVITPTSLVVFFDEYQIGPYALGSYKMEIPLTDLVSYLRTDVPFTISSVE
jgi:hypothetical protein